MCHSKGRIKLIKMQKDEDTLSVFKSLSDEEKLEAYALMVERETNCWEIIEE